jgi:hypothetical protein
LPNSIDFAYIGGLLHAIFVSGWLTDFFIFENNMLFKKGFMLASVMM